MNILHLTTTDPAGAAYAMAQAVNSHTPHRARVITTHRIEAFAFPTDIHYIFDGGDEVSALMEQADVLHLHKVDPDFKVEVNMKKSGIQRSFVVKDLLKAFPQKKVVYHIHGHPYERESFKENAENYKRLGGKVLASTPDLEEMYRPYYDQVFYFPNIVPINDILYLPRPTDKMIPMADGVERLFVVQTPTHAILKNCHVIETAVRNVGERLKLPVVYHKIWGKTREEALRHKRHGHVVFDHIEGYYGLSSLEGLSMGKPVIAGLSEYTMNAIRKFFNLPDNPADPLPWIIARDPQEVEQALQTLLADDALRAHIGQQSRKFMEEVWSDRALGQRLAAFYASL